jgi:DNA-binding MarR family transcriptional regulator
MSGTVPAGNTVPPLASPAGAVSPDRLTADLGWGLAVVFRGYVKATDVVTEGLAGGHRGYQVLSAAARDEPGSQAALAARLGIDRTVMTYLLDDLVKAGLVERQQDPGDRRARLVVATDQGRTVLAELETRFAHAERHILAGLSEQEQAAFRALLRTLATHVNDLDPVATACDAVVDIGARTQG